MPGKQNEHINELDFGEIPPKQQYLFHKMRPHGLQIVSNEDEKKDKGKLEENNG